METGTQGWEEQQKAAAEMQNATEIYFRHTFSTSQRQSATLRHTAFQYLTGVLVINMHPETR